MCLTNSTQEPIFKHRFSNCKYKVKPNTYFLILSKLFTQCRWKGWENLNVNRLSLKLCSIMSETRRGILFPQILDISPTSVKNIILCEVGLHKVILILDLDIIFPSLDLDLVFLSLDLINFFLSLYQDLDVIFWLQSRSNFPSLGLDLNLIFRSFPSPDLDLIFLSSFMSNFRSNFYRSRCGSNFSDSISRSFFLSFAPLLTSHINYVHVQCLVIVLKKLTEFIILLFQAVGGVCFLFSIWPNLLTSKIVGVYLVFVAVFSPISLLIFVYGRIAWVLSRKATNDVLADKMSKDTSKDKVVNTSTDLRMKSIYRRKETQLKPCFW